MRLFGVFALLSAAAPYAASAEAKTDITSHLFHRATIYEETANTTQDAEKAAQMRANASLLEMAAQGLESKSVEGLLSAKELTKKSPSHPKECDQLLGPSE